MATTTPNSPRPHARDSAPTESVLRAASRSAPTFGGRYANPNRQNLEAAFLNPAFVATVEVEYDAGFNDPDRGPVQVWSEPFVRLPDGSWASDAFVAARRGRAGTAVYAEALHLPPSNGDLPRRIRIGPAYFRRFRGLEATVLGVLRPGRSHRILVTAAPALCDRNWVTERRTSLAAVVNRLASIDVAWLELNAIMPAGWAFFGISATTTGEYEAVAYRPGDRAHPVHVRGRGPDVPSAIARLCDQLVTRAA